MKISTKGRYALRLMIDLALHDTGESIPIKQIADRQDISGKYLEQIISMLTRAGFVLSTRGAHGGYRLARPAGEYTAGMILRLTEGGLAPVACLEQGAPLCDRQSSCATLMLWKRLDQAISEVVDHVTLEELAEIQRAQNENNYCI